MDYKDTVAILGANSRLGNVIAKGICKQYRLLLMDEQIHPLTALANDIAKLNCNATAEVIQCCKDASWEADIIIVVAGEAAQAAIAAKIKEVATCKTVINMVSAANGNISLQQLLPHSKVVTILFDANQDDQGWSIVSMEGTDDAAKTIAMEMMQLIGLRVA
jgi:hypothetical protein